MAGGATLGWLVAGAGVSLMEMVGMGLRFLGKDPGSAVNGSPTVWLDETTGDYVLQGWKITDGQTLREVGQVPEHETIMRFPRRMMPFFLETLTPDATDATSSMGEG